MNVGGIVVIAAGVLLVVIALRGTQSNVFPSLFPVPTPSVPIAQDPNLKRPAVGGQCPTGWILDPSTQTCYNLIGA